MNTVKNAKITKNSKIRHPQKKGDKRQVTRALTKTAKTTNTAKTTKIAKNSKIGHLQKKGTSNKAEGHRQKLQIWCENCEFDENY